MAAAQCPRRVRIFGERLAAFLGSKPIVEILPDPNYHTWLEGGCWILAQALHEWLGAPLWAVWDKREEAVEHVVVRIDGCYLDGRGASTKKELLDSFSALGYLPKMVRFKPEDAPDIDCPLDVVDRLKEALKTQFGGSE